jgi:2-dehydro-3-deoxy-D-arabinonate dehydratase
MVAAVESLNSGGFFTRQVGAGSDSLSRQDATSCGEFTGACIGYISPEALAGRAIGGVRDGDVIQIVVDRNALHGAVNLAGEARGAMKLFLTNSGIFAEQKSRYFLLPIDNWDELICTENLFGYVNDAISGHGVDERDIGEVLAPIGNQEVWAAGVTYYRSRNARMEESKIAGGGDFYDRVYAAERPELFFKANGRRVVGPGGGVRVRSDAKWSVPEPELTLVINAAGNIVGCTIGNDMSSRDIEGENPLYLPQAKVYDRSCALGPCVQLVEDLPSVTTKITLEIVRSERKVFAGSTSLAELKRKPEQLVEYLFRDNSFPRGAYLMTGTGVVPNDDFSLLSGDRIRISIDGIGVLENFVL